VILVDDGMATGSSMRVAVVALRKRQPARLIVAVPAGAPETCSEFRAEADEAVYATTPEWFAGVGKWHHDFYQTSDDEVRLLLAQADRSGR
jgi:predicted phosphoribosyltransferase